MFYLKENIYILALEIAGPGNQHCANRIGILSFPVHETNIAKDLEVSTVTVTEEIRVIDSDVLRTVRIARRIFAAPGVFRVWGQNPIRHPGMDKKREDTTEGGTGECIVRGEMEKRGKEGRNKSKHWIAA